MYGEAMLDSISLLTLLPITLPSDKALNLPLGV